MVEVRLFINSPVAGRTKLASAEAMNRMDPIMFNQAINHGNEPARELSERPTARMAKALEIKNSADQKGSARQPRRSCCCAVRLCASAARVLMLKKIVPGNW